LLPHEKQQEFWLPIPGNENYLISSVGRIKSKSSYAGKWRLLVPTVRDNKYLYITLSVNGKRKGFALDRLMTASFNRLDYKKIKAVEHLDGNKLNNRLSNLNAILKN